MVGQPPEYISSHFLMQPPHTVLKLISFKYDVLCWFVMLAETNHPTIQPIPSQCVSGVLCA